MRCFTSVWFSALFSSIIVSAQTEGELQRLRNNLLKHGIQTVFPDDDGYAAAIRPWNDRFSYKPVAVTFPVNSTQVSYALQIGASFDINVAARSGGHSYIANGLGGKNNSLVIDLSLLKNKTYDASTGIATIQPGNRLGEVALFLNEHNRGVPHGRCPYVGLGGHSGFGGFGLASRMWGLTLDNVVSAMVVLPDGREMLVTPNWNDDLFWAIRGSSASFGIVTSIDLQTHAVPKENTVFLYTYELSASQASRSLQAFQDFTVSKTSPLPANFYSELVFIKGASKGVFTVILFGGYFGPYSNFNATVQPFLSTFDASTPPVDVSITRGDWLTFLNASAFGVGPLNTTTQPDGSDNFYAKSIMTPESQLMTPQAIDEVFTYLDTHGWDIDLTFDIEVEFWGGQNSAINAVPLDATAFAHRDTHFTMQLYGSNGDPTKSYPAGGVDFMNSLAAKFVDNMPSDWPWAAYPNYIDDHLQNWQQRYYGAHYPRLQTLKEKYDPTDVFRFPTAIEQPH